MSTVSIDVDLDQVLDGAELKDVVKYYVDNDCMDDLVSELDLDDGEEFVPVKDVPTKVEDMTIKQLHNVLCDRYALSHIGTTEQMLNKLVEEFKHGFEKKKF